MMQFLPGTDFIFSGYAGTPNYDNLFAGSNFDAEDFDDYNVLQRDLMVDGGLRPVKEDDVINVRYTAAKVMQGLFKELRLSAITDEEVEAAAYAHGSRDVPLREPAYDLEAVEEIKRRNITGIDIVKALKKAGFDDTARSILEMLKQRITGDYMQTSAILDEEFKVISAVNHPNDYIGPGTGYRVQGERWEEIKNIPHIIDPDDM
jgi:propanediol dehydratase large subunit